MAPAENLLAQAPACLVQLLDGVRLKGAPSVFVRGLRRMILGLMYTRRVKTCHLEAQ